MAVAQDGFLNITSTYDIKVDDLVNFRTDSQQDSDHSHADDRELGAGTVLVSKICDALSHWGDYTEEDVQKVGNLVAQNLITCTSSQASQINPSLLQGPQGRHSAWEKIDVMLTGLLEHDIPRSKTVHMNSNEPVLLINFGSSLERYMLESITAHTVMHLQNDWSIWPVRVYAGAFVPATAGQQSADGDFSITLLNVVNTEIGGPSMPQLLDAPCDAPEWDRCWRREVWRGRDLVSRDVDDRILSHFEEKRVDDSASEHSVTSADDNESVGSDALSLAILKNPMQERSDSPEPKPERTSTQEDELDNQKLPALPAGNDEQLLTQPEKSAAVQIPVEQPHLMEAASQAEGLPEQPNLPEKHIDHPSWERVDDSTSLLDLIRSQASLLAPFGSGSVGHGVPDVEGDVALGKESESEPPSSFEDVEHAATKSDLGRAKSPDDDEFVVV